MRSLLTFFAALVVFLGLLSFAGYEALDAVTREWFERDLALREELAIASAGQGLVEAFERGPSSLSRILDGITRDERILGAAACDTGGTRVASTDAYPHELGCRAVLQEGAEPSAARYERLEGGPVHVRAFPIVDGERVLGTVLLVHDLRYLDARGGTTRDIVLVLFFLVSALAALVTVLSARLARRDWTLGLRQALEGGSPGSSELDPLLRDVRSLVERLAEERGQEARAGAWSAERLRATLRSNLDGDRIVLLANREPYIHETRGDAVEVLHPASGLVTALEPVMRACSGTWVAHGSGSADRSTADAHGRIAVPPGEESYTLRRVWLTTEEENGYYYGFANEGLWPLCHVAHARPMFRASDWEHYVRVNRRFAEAVCEESDTDDPIVLVQDYHFALAPRLIRERLPRATILTFWHIPWPNAERIGICPWREEILEGLLGSSILGFHTQQHCNNFIDSVDSYVESRIDRERRAIVRRDSGETLVRPYPISIEWPVRWMDGIASVEACRREVRKELGLAPDALLAIGVDRMDYTKGIEERLEAVDLLLERAPSLRGRFTFVQLAAPSRTHIERYRELDVRVRALTDRINARWGRDGYLPILLRIAHHEPPTVFRYYRASELCYVSSLHDGMNLVAKEFVAARDDEQGVLVLSQFTGAARDLTEALVVNPYDTQQAAQALEVALRMPVAEQRLRMRSMRRLVSELNVFRWAGRMLLDAAELRRKERLSGHLSFVGEGRLALEGILPRGAA
ncbi:MAG: trehalose-6-phosphate synthase [Deltaproteobacteria bacterium]|jgi:trehalose 6-phosphate synthase